jgi:hypothetical protein
MFKQIRLYSFTIPLALWPILDFSVSEIVPYLKGMEFRAFMAQIVAQLVSGTIDAFIIAAVSSAFGTL